MPWTPIGMMRRGQRPDFTLLNKPGNIYVTNAQRWFTDQLIHLEPRTVIAGWYSHKPGYHDTVEHNDARDKALGTDDYSTRDPEDRRGPRNKGRASDWTFRDAQAGDFNSFAKYGDRLMLAYRNSDPRVGAWREYLGRVSTTVVVNGKSTKRVGIDFRHHYLRIPDSTHDWHAHFSEDTEQVESFWNKWAMLTVLAGWTLAEWQQSIEEDEDMALSVTQDERLFNCEVYGKAAVTGQDAVGLKAGGGNVVTVPNATARKIDALTSAVALLDEEVAERLRVDLDEIDAAVAAVAVEVQEVPAETVQALLEQPADTAADTLIAVLGPERAAQLAEAVRAKVA